MAAPSLDDVYKKLIALTSTVDAIAKTLHVTRYQVEKGKIVKDVVPHRSSTGKGSSKK